MPMPPPDWVVRQPDENNLPVRPVGKKWTNEVGPNGFHDDEKDAINAAIGWWEMLICGLGDTEDPLRNSFNVTFRATETITFAFDSHGEATANHSSN